MSCLNLGLPNLQLCNPITVWDRVNFRKTRLDSTPIARNCTPCVAIQSVYQFQRYYPMSQEEGTALTLHPLASTSSTSAGPVPTSGSGPGVKRFVRQQVPDDILHNTALNQAIQALPANYNFEIHKTIWRLRSAGARCVALQFPEGLLMYATTIADIVTHFAGVDHVLVMGDVTYGACCVDDFSAKAMGADFLVHYGHSCLVPVDVTGIPCMYVFVDIAIDVDHLVGCVRLTFPAGTALVLAGTIQFSSAIQAARAQLAVDYPSLSIPKCRPLSPGEVLGCTAPVITTQADAIVFVADGRFHLEAMMIANPTIPAYRYDPYPRKLTREHYDHVGMRAARRAAVESSRSARRWGVVLGTLGRQGNPALLDTLHTSLHDKGHTVTQFLISELSPQRLALIQDIDAWVQVACPRLSIDWGEAFKQPTLTPYEAMVSLGLVPPWWEQPPVAPQAQAQAQQHDDVSCSGLVQPAARQLQGLAISEAAGQSQQVGSGTCGTCGADRPAASTCGSQGAAASGRSPVSPCTGSASSSSGMFVESVPPEGCTPYPMDFYAKEGGKWNSSYHKEVRPRTNPVAAA